MKSKYGRWLEDQWKDIKEYVQTSYINEGAF